ncbi:FtsQ-type POTRA domain-containing protein [Agromyces laixinhei]|uniref:FtsQ-type POTRA domain-containing protein n=1 Tax=Agromyces laixinhei TaxID=2585717 RepID=UPI0012EDED07|nr:FtsQ-type POTRA domain-containing protein [Agromyces laixinhei]
MKRPQGFDGPIARTSRSAATQQPAAAARDASRSHGSDADRVTTEPIAIVVDVPVPPRIDAADPDPGTGQARPVTPKSARTAKRELAAAARERRRYERQEVRRFTKRSRRRRIAWSVGLGSIAALVVVVAVGAYSPLMALREVRVEGASRIPVTEVQAAFDEQLGTPLPLIASADVLAALSSFPLIETYSTETVPPGTLVVRIVERVPVGVVDTGDGLELVDAAGVVIERPEERPDGQPLIVAEGGVAGEGFRAAAAVIRSLPAEVRSLLVGASAATADDVRLELSTGATVVWGSAEESAQKAAVLARLMVAAPPDSVGEYDVSSPTSAVTR